MREIKIASWSNVLPTKTRILNFNQNTFDKLQKPFIPRGSGRSFGDQAYISNGTTLSSKELNHISEFDPQQGTIVCGSGVQMRELYHYLESTDWNFPVAGGTQWVTIGGAAAADIHGKNDVDQGSFGNHIESLEIIIANGKKLECSKEKNADLYSATIGGMGLTGLIISAKLRLQKSRAKVIQANSRPFYGIEEMMEYYDRTKCDMHVAWLDLTSSLPRGIFHFASYLEGRKDDFHRTVNIKIPRVKLFNRRTVRVMSALRFKSEKSINKITDFRNFHYVVDSFKYWNRLYGSKGFQEYQFCVPTKYFQKACAEFIESTKRFHLTPLFTVIKKFGDKPREGLLSFPKEGYTLTTHFEMKADNQKLFHHFTNLLFGLDGKINLAKDSYLERGQFEKMESNVNYWRKIAKTYDPQNSIQSDLSRRLGIKPW